MIRFGHSIKTTVPLLKQTGNFIKVNPRLLIEGVLLGSLLVSVRCNIQSENKYMYQNRLYKEQLSKIRAIINDFNSIVEKVDKLEKCNDSLMDALTKL